LNLLKRQPTTNTKFPDGLFAYQRTQQYKICHARSEKVSITAYSRPFYNHRTKPT